MYAYCKVSSENYETLSQIKQSIRDNEALQIKIYLYLNFLLISALVAGNFIYFTQDKSITH